MVYAIDYYPNTDRMKTTVQHSPQIILEGALLLPEPQTPKEVRTKSCFIARESPSRVDNLHALPCASITIQ